MDLGVAGYEDAVEVGRGGFAIVYRAWQPGFDRYVAIKVVSSNLDATAMSRFERECLAIGALSEHPNIVTVHELGWTADGRPFIVMEFLTGGSLGARVDRDGPLTWQQATEMTIKVAGALESAHRAGVLHRDVKPDNVLVSRYGDIKLGDFGIARIQGHSETMTGGVTASWSHAPPELVAGKRPSVASDVYSLSSMLYTLVAGDPPFHRRDDEGLLPMLARIPSEPVPDLRPAGVPAALCRVIEQGMAKDPAERPSSAAEIGRRLQEAQAAARQPVTALPLEIVDVAGKIGIQLPSLDPAGSEEGKEGRGRSTNVVFPTYAAGAPPIPADAPPASVPDPPQAPPPMVVEPIAEPPSPPVRRSRRSVVLAIVALSAVVVAVGAVLLLGGGGDESPTAQPATTVQQPVPTTVTPSSVAPTVVTTPPTTAPVVRFTVSDELLPEDASEEVELTIDSGSPVRFAGSPAGVSRPVSLTVPTAGRHSYRVVVRTTSKSGATATLNGTGTIDVQEGRHFEVAYVGPGRACLAVDGMCQE